MHLNRATSLTSTTIGGDLSVMPHHQYNTPSEIKGPSVVSNVRSIQRMLFLNVFFVNSNILKITKLYIIIFLMKSNKTVGKWWIGKPRAQYRLWTTLLSLPHMTLAKPRAKRVRYILVIKRAVVSRQTARSTLTPRDDVRHTVHRQQQVNQVS